MLDLALRLARAAGRIQRERYEGTLEIATKSSAVDLVTDVDHACEALIVNTLATDRPQDAVLAEEGGVHGRPDAAWRWVIDPLDGTTNYAHGYPRFCVSIAVEQHRVGRIAAIYDPILDELYHAVRAGGAFRNGEPIRVSAEDDLGRSMVATGFGYDRRRNPGENLGRIEAVLRSAQAVRRDGSAALDLCAVACGRFDGYWELKLAPWDVAAGRLIVEEAGGRCSDLAGEPAPVSGGEIVASNGRIHAALLEVLASAAQRRAQ